MDKKKRLLSGITVAGFLAASVLPALTFAGEETAPTKEDQKVEGKKGSCSGKGGCGAMKDKEKKEAKGEKKGSCSGMKDEEKKEDEKKEEGKKGSCTAMK